jgi:hypothetical protein
MVKLKTSTGTIIFIIWEEKILNLPVEKEVT